MNPTTQEQLTTVVETMQSAYERHRHHRHYSLPGMCYGWDAKIEALTEEPEQALAKRLIPLLLTDMKEAGIRIERPRIYVPRSRDRQEHFTALALRNIGAIAAYSQSVVGADKAKLLDDRHLLYEAAYQYIEEYAAGKREQTDFFDYLITETTYNGVLERLLVRYEQSTDMFMQLEDLLPEEMYAELSMYHYQAEQAKIPSVSDDLQRLAEAYAQPSKEERAVMPRLSPKRLFGKRRVRIGWRGGGYVDLQAHAERLQSRGMIHLDPNAIVMQRIINAMVDEAMEAYRSDPQQCMADLEKRLDEASGAEAQALSTTKELLQNIESFDESNRIKHTMTIMTKGATE
jgi:hypothetical protein